ncbi:MAG: methionine--tRNA ligase [Clostridia bacterium]
MNVLIGGAWPYANGSLHIGHVAGLISGDVLARYYRLKGDDVLYVSGSDCHGTPIAIRAKNENIEPREITDKYHSEIVKFFTKLGFSFDNYSRTDNEFHKKEVKKIFKRIWDNGYLYPKTIEQLYCEFDEQFLPDRYVEGICPHCGAQARGDQCDSCTSLLDPMDLEERRCALCGNEPVVKETTHLYFKLSDFQEELEKFVKDAEGWRENAIKLTQRYLDEGLHDRAVTRDIDLGIQTPIEGYEDKRIYVWMEAVCGYLTASKEWAKNHNKHWEKFWKGDNIRSYYIHGKDNVPFHSIIWPAILLAHGDLHLPDQIISSEYLTLERRKISTSQNWAVWLPDIASRYQADSIRYFIIINGPEKRDADFSWREFVNSNNGELLGAFGNFVNRNLVFLKKSFDTKVPDGKMDDQIKENIKALYRSAGELIEQGEFKASLEEIFAFIRDSNKYFDERQPWVQVKEDINAANDTLYTCVQIIANLANLVEPFTPFAAEKIKSFLQIEELSWEYIEVDRGVEIGEVEILFERLDESIIEEELERLKN